MNQSFIEFSGNALYLDTMVFHIFLRVKDSAAEPLFEATQRGDIQTFTSALTFDELAFRMLLASIRDKYDGSPLDRLRQDEQSMIAEFYPRIEPKLVLMQTFPNLTVLDVTLADLVAMHQNMLAHHLRPRDAIHMAAMQKCGCMNIVSHDSDFDHIPTINRYVLS